MMNNPWFWMSWGMWIVPAIVIIILWKLSSGNHTMHHHHYYQDNSDKKESPETPLDILKKRYAKGEITKNELEEMKKNIS
jgi:putative membrane protein